MKGGRLTAAALAACLVLRCASTQLSVNEDHPASAAAQSVAVQPVGGALDADFVPPQASNGERAPSPSEADAAASWTCPMHPQVVQSKPGNCPICGMKLEPVKSRPPGGAEP
jgi:hypothetical protein